MRTSARWMKDGLRLVYEEREDGQSVLVSYQVLTEERKRLSAEAAAAAVRGRRATVHR